MAVRFADYYKEFLTRAILLIAGTQVVVAILLAAALWFFAGRISDTSALILLAIGSFTILEAIVAALTIPIITEPTKMFAQAITHVSKQASDLEPPNINDPRHEKSGLKPMIQTIYELAVSPPQPQLAAQTDLAKEPLITGAMAKELLVNMPCGIIAMNSDHEIVFANDRAPVRLNTKEEKELVLLFEDDDSLASWLAECEQTKVHDQKVWTKVANKLPDENDRRVFDVIAAYSKGSSAETILITVDHSAQYAPIEEDLDFIALAAHELRGPVTVIRGYLDILGDELEKVLQPDQKELVDRLNVSANRLSGYINNVLNVSRYDRRHLKLHLHEDRLSDIIGTITDDLNMRAHTQNRLLGFELPNDLPTIAADRNSLGEVISNLVDNAIKYSHEGGQIIVRAEVKGDFVEMTVQDSGIGMPASVTGHLFQKFYRSHRSRQSVAGTGLGLYICKAIIESHGGKIWARSTEGQGSTFGFTVPVYSTVANKLIDSNNGNEGIIQTTHGWIKNHSMFRG